MASGLCVPHQQAAHMAAPTEGQNIKKNLANGEPSTHGAKRTMAELGEWPLLTQSGYYSLFQKGKLANAAEYYRMLAFADSSMNPSRFGILIFGKLLASSTAFFLTMPSTDKI
jgi:hypothetical protein